MKPHAESLTVQETFAQHSHDRINEGNISAPSFFPSCQPFCFKFKMEIKIAWSRSHIRKSEREFHVRTTNKTSYAQNQVYGNMISPVIFTENQM